MHYNRSQQNPHINKYVYHTTRYESKSEHGRLSHCTACVWPIPPVISVVQNKLTWLTGVCPSVSFLASDLIARTTVIIVTTLHWHIVGILDAGGYYAHHYLFARHLRVHWWLVRGCSEGIISQTAPYRGCRPRPRGVHECRRAGASVSATTSRTFSRDATS